MAKPIPVMAFVFSAYYSTAKATGVENRVSDKIVLKPLPWVSCPVGELVKPMPKIAPLTPSSELDEKHGFAADRGSASQLMAELTVPLRGRS